MLTRKRYLKILVSGPYASGKTTFIKTLCKRVLTTDVRVSAKYESYVKETTTVAFDFGKLFYNETPVYLFGTPGQTRFNFMWKVLSLGIHGYIYILDGSSLREVLRGRTLYEFMKSIGDFPHIIAVNKQDLPGAINPLRVARLFNIDKKRVIPLIALRRDSAMQAIEKIISVIDEEESSRQKDLASAYYRQ